MRPLGCATARALAEIVDILESLAGHLPVSLPRVRNLILWHCSENRLPNVVQQRGKLQADARNRKREDWEESAELARQSRPTRNRVDGSRGESRQQSC